MSAQKGDKAGAAILILVFLTIALISFFGAAARYYAAYPPSENPSEWVDSQHGEHEPPAEFAPDYHMFGDSAAQWIMAIFTVIATVVSAIAVMLVNNTLSVNREALRVAAEANKNAREVGFSQIRAYVSLVDLVGTTDPVSKTMAISVGIQNSGQTPAHDVSIRVWLVRTQEDGRDILTAGSRSFDDHSDLMPGEKRPIYAEQISFYNVINDPLQANSLDAYLDKRTAYFLRGFIRYKIVGADWQRETAFNYRLSGWHKSRPVAVVFSRELDGNRRT
jgi:hypothetical protein